MAGGKVGLARQRTAVPGAEEAFLAEVGHHPVAIGFVELDQLHEVMDEGLSPEAGKVSVDVVLEFEGHRLALGFAQGRRRREVDWVDELGPEVAQRSEGLFEDGVDLRVGAPEAASDTDSGAAKAGRVEASGVGGS